MGIPGGECCSTNKSASDAASAKDDCADLQEIATVLQVLQEPIKTLAITVPMAGLRIDEALALRWRNLDFEKNSSRFAKQSMKGTPSLKAASVTFRWGHRLSACYRKAGRPHLLTHLYLPVGAARHWTGTIY